MAQAGGGGNKQSDWMKMHGGKEKVGQMYKNYVANFNKKHAETPVPETPVSETPVSETPPGDISESGKKALSTYSKDRAAANAIRFSRPKKKARKKAAETLAEKLLAMPKPMQESLVAKMKPTIVTSLRQSKYKKELADTGLWQFAIKKPTEDFDETEGQGPDMGRSGRSIDAEQVAFKKGGWSEVKKLRAAQSPDDKMQTFNNVQEKNRTLQDGKSGSPTVVNTTNAQSTNVKGGDLLATLPKAFAAPRLKESLNDPVY